MKLNPYLMFDGQCEAAFKLYEQCLGGKIEAMLPYKDMPDSGELPAKLKDKIMHASLRVDGQVLMGSDCTPEHPYEGVKGCSVTINVDSVAEADRIFNTLAADGKVEMPLQQTFWAARFGSLVDRFGVSWLVNCEKAG